MWMRDLVFRYSLAHYLAAKKLTGQNINAMPRVQTLFGELSRNVLRPHTETEKCKIPRKTTADIAEDRLDSGTFLAYLWV